MGLIPQARHGGSGVWAFAVTGSKLDGTGLEKLHIVQTQVAEVACDCSGFDLGLSERVRDDPFRWWLAPETAEGNMDERLGGFGINVIFAEDLKNPA